MEDSAIRRRSLGSVEIADGHGGKKVMNMNDMSEADRALAEQFGYKPV